MTTVNTNINAVKAQHALELNQRGLTQTMTELTTSKRINSAADDAAGSAISAKLATQARSLLVAVRNTNDSISMIQTADGAADGIQQMLYRLKELAVQAVNDSNSGDERIALNNEFQHLEAQIRDTVSNTKWNGIALLDGSMNSNTGIATFQVGAAAADGVAVQFSDFDLSTHPLAAARYIDTGTNAGAALTSIDAAIHQVSSARATWGAAMNRLMHAGDNATQVTQNLSASQSRIMDADYAKATAELARSLILDEAGSAMLTQANQQPYYVLALLQ